MRLLHLKSIFALFILFLLFSCSEKETTTKTDNPYLFREYIGQFPSARQSVTQPIEINLSKSLDFFSETQEIPSSFVEIQPKTEGKLLIKNPRQLIFIPEKNLKPDTEYLITLKLNRLFDKVPKDLKTYTFSFRTIEPNFSIRTENLQSYSQEWQYLEGILESADYIEPEDLPKLFSVSQDRSPIPVKWQSSNAPANYFSFVIDSIKRKEDDSNILLKWDGSSIKSKTKGEQEFLIPGYNNFKIVDIQTHAPPKASLSINFSDPLDANQDFSGLVKIDSLDNLKYQTEGNVLHVYPSRKVGGELEIKVFPGIKNTQGLTLKEVYSERISFEQVKPAVELISKGVIFPQATSTPLYFKTVNLKAVDVRVIKIYEDNVLEFLQDGNLNNVYEYNLPRVGKRIAKKTIQLKTDEKEKDHWKAHALKLSDFFKADPGALYQVEISFKKEYSLYDCPGQEEENEYLLTAEDQAEEEREERYWNNETHNWRKYIYDWKNRNNPCYPVYYQPDNFVTTNLLGSDLGLIAKKGGDNSYEIFASNLLTAQPESQVNISFYDYQKQKITEKTTASSGKISYKGKETAAFAVAKKGKHYAYLNLENSNALSLSKFDVSGSGLEKGLKGFIYTERGVHRPGDTIHLSFVLNDKENPLPKEVPVIFEVENARGKLIKREVVSDDKSDPHSSNRFYYFPISTRITDETGNWRVRVLAGGAEFTKTLRVATVKPNRLRIKLDFDQDILDAQTPITGKLEGSWLHGAPARNLKAEMEVTLSNAGNVFEDYQQYIFTDPVRRFEQTEIPFTKGQLSEQSVLAFNKKIPINQKAPGMLRATFLTKLFEGGGDFSMDVFSKNLAPFEYFVGMQSPETDEFGSLNVDKNQRFEVISLDKNGKTAAGRNLKVQVYKIEWRWWWSHQEDNLSQYENSRIHRPYMTEEITTDQSGKSHFTLNIPEKDRGRYLIRVIDEKSGHATGNTVYFFKDWFDSDAGDADSAKMLVFSADKKEYNVGETAKITFPSGAGGQALISIENGTKVLSSKWVQTQKTSTEVDLVLTPDMAPNVFVNISLLQPHERVKNDLPIRLYGVIPLKVEDPNSVLKPKINMPDELKPREKFNIKISEENKKAMTYTLAIVEEGLLDLTRFPTPDIHAAFYSREALGVKTFDLYDYVIGAYSGSINNIYEIGGDDAAQAGKKTKANRFKPVVKYLGPFYLKPGETRSHSVELPNYIGSIRTMVIAGDAENAAYGKTEKTTEVKKPLMVLASLPRKLSPGETLKLPVTVFAMEDKIRKVQVDVTTSDALQAIDGKTKTLNFEKPDEKIIDFDYQVQASDKVQKIKVEVSGHGEKASYEVEIDVENPNPFSHKIKDFEIQKNSTEKMTYSPYGVEGTNSVKLELSTLPPMNFTKLLQYLENYPHGCVEQITSTAFPLLFLDEIMDLSSNRKSKFKNDIKEVIQRVGDAQLTNGSLPFWPGQRQSNHWVTSYAGHFMLEAKEKGYALPISFLSNWINFQKRQAREWNIHDYSYNTSLTQAYRLYTLALAGQPELAAMNRLRESQHMTNDAKWRLAAAYALAGRKEVAKDIIRTANTNFYSSRQDLFNYGSPLRNQAMVLETMVILEDDQQREIAISLAKKMNDNPWLNTQETGYSLLAMAKMLRKSGGKEMDLSILQNGKTHSVKTTNSLAEIDLIADDKENNFEIKNNKDNIVYAALYQEGKPALGQEKAEGKNLSIKTVFVDGEGKVLDVSKIRQGTEIEAKISITNTSLDDISVVALTQTFPSGWEIINTSFTELQSGISNQADYTDIRDDRVHFYFDIKKKQTKTFRVKLNASYLGKYYSPGSFAEGMYDRNYYVREKGRWVEIHP